MSLKGLSRVSDRGKMPAGEQHLKVRSHAASILHRKCFLTAISLSVTRSVDRCRGCFSGELVDCMREGGKRNL